MTKCPAPKGWPKRPSAVTILGPRWPKTPSAVTAAKGASPKAQKKPRSPTDYSRLRLLFTSRSSPPGHFLASHCHFRGPFWPAPFRIRHRGAAFWPFWPFSPSAVPTLHNSQACCLIIDLSASHIIACFGHGCRCWGRGRLFVQSQGLVHAERASMNRVVFTNPFWQTAIHEPSLTW